MIFDGTTKDNENIWLYFRSMGKIFRIAAITETDEEANAFTKRKNRFQDQYGVIGETAEGYNVIAELMGEKIITKR